MISDLILCHKVRKLFAIIITQKEEIRSQIYRKTRFILSIEKQIFLTNCSRIFLSRIESLLLANIHIRFMNKKHLFALLFTLLVWTSCNNQQHFITDAAYRAEVENDFQADVYKRQDVYKALEGMAYSLINNPNPELEKKADEWIDKFAAAQLPDGYINTYYTLTAPEKRWTNMDKHEMYCAGHMIEAGVAYYKRCV